MSSKTVGIIVLVLVIAGGAYLYTNKDKTTESDSMMKDDSMTQETSMNSDTEMQGSMKMSPEAGRVVGKWRSTEDAKFTREFREDGTATDMYEGDASATATGPWSQVVDIAAEGVQLPPVDGATIIKMMFNNEPYYFAVSTDTTVDKLVLINLSGRGNILSFTRIQ